MRPTGCRCSSTPCSPRPPRWSAESPDSWLDEVQSHKITELARQGRLQLSAQEIDDWTNAVNTVSVAADRLYALLIQNKPLRDWVVADYFSPFTLHQRLLEHWFPEITRGRGRRPAGRRPGDRGRSSPSGTGSARILDAVPRRPAAAPRGRRATTTRAERPRPGAAHPGAAARAQRRDDTRARLRSALLDLLPEAAGPGIEADLDTHALRFEFTLDPRRAAPPARLRDRHVAPVVEAALNLDYTSNVLSRRPPRDYEPFIPESPMGNVLGFQFQLDDGGRAGRCGSSGAAASAGNCFSACTTCPPSTASRARTCC